MDAPGDLESRMSQLARDLQSEPTTDDTLQHVVAAAVDLIGSCHSAGISLVSGKNHIKTSACTGPLPRESDRKQEELREGPCLQAAWGQELVSVPHLDRETRWPAWSPWAVRELGVRSMVCVRLFTHDNRLGALNLFALEPAAFTPADLDEATAVAAHAAVAMVAAEKIDGLGAAIHNRTVLGQATGLLMAQYDVTSRQAFNLLRRLSSEQNRKIIVIADELIESHGQSVSRPKMAPSTRDTAPGQG